MSVSAHWNTQSRKFKEMPPPLLKQRVLLYSEPYNSDNQQEKSGAWWKQPLTPCLRAFSSSFNWVSIILTFMVSMQYFWMAYVWTLIEGNLFILVWRKCFIQKVGSYTFCWQLYPFCGHDGHFVFCKRMVIAGK